MPKNIDLILICIIIIVIYIIFFNNSVLRLHDDNSYVNNSIVPYEKYDTIIPPVVHRIRLYDSEFPHDILDCLDNFQKLNPQFYHVLWNEQSIIDIMDENEKLIYKNYSKKIQKADYARYIVLKYYGGIYCDYDIEVEQSIYTLYDKYKNDDIILFEEVTLNANDMIDSLKYSIRNNIPEVPLRIANYIMASKPNSIGINYILKLCKERSVLKLNEDYDILYTTGPDVVSTVFDKHKNDKWLSHLSYIPLSISVKYFSHLCAGHWRDENQFFSTIKNWFHKYIYLSFI